MVAATELQLRTSPALIAAIGALAVAIWMAFRQDDDSLPKLFLVIMCIPVVGMASGLSLQAANKAYPWKFDYVLYGIDHALAYSPSLVGGAVFSSHAGQAMVGFIYSSIAIAMAFCYARALRSSTARPNRLLIAYLINLVVGCALYWLVPACGPVYAFGRGFRSNLPVPVVSRIELNGDPNAIPSLHFSTALIMLFFSRDDPKTRIATVLYAAATAVVTLATGEHYLVDLVVAAPFALFAISIAEGCWRRGILAFASVMGWLLAIRFDASILVQHPLLLRSAAAVTVLMSVALIFMASSRSTGAIDTIGISNVPHLDVVDFEQRR